MFGSSMSQLSPNSSRLQTHARTPCSYEGRHISVAVMMSDLNRIVVRPSDMDELHAPSALHRRLELQYLLCGTGGRTSCTRQSVLSQFMYFVCPTIVTVRCRTSVVLCSLLWNRNQHSWCHILLLVALFQEGCIRNIT